MHAVLFFRKKQKQGKNIARVLLIKGIKEFEQDSSF